FSFSTIDAEWEKGTAKAYPTPDASETEVIDLKGLKDNYVPDYEYNVGLDFYLLQQTDHGSLTASVDIRGFGEQYEDYCNNFKMEAADFVDLKLTWTRDRYELYLNSTNIFDKEWNKYVNSTGKPHEELGGMSGVYPQDGRYVGIGGSVHF
ncbi:MAG: TonB-dependent receptor, partial [Desulfobacteraceae bacterium]